MFQVFEGNGKNITWELLIAVSTLMVLQLGNLCSTGQGLCCQECQHELRKGKVLFPTSSSHSTSFSLCRAQTS